MSEMKKFKDNKAEVQKAIDKARVNFKDKHKQYPDFDENKISRQQFRLMLQDISVDLEMPFPTKEQAYELFDTFNNDLGKDGDFLEKQQFQNFKDRVRDMLSTE